VADDEKLKRERAGTYRTADGRFTIEQSATGWLLLDGEQTNELGLPLARGPYATLDEARGAIAVARTGPRPISDLDEHRASKRAAKPAPGGAAQRPPGARAGKARSAPPRPTGKELVIRELRTVDGDALRRLWQSVGFRSIGDDDRSLARLARRNPGLVLVATEGGRVVGSALGAWDGRRGWIYHVTTVESHRRRGIATRLVAQVESGLRDIGCQEVRVNIGEANAEARSFWQARGYAIRPTRQLGRNLGDHS
jgi:ribosomal protein S18 acetylase RimI-like enzyme